MESSSLQSVPVELDAGDLPLVLPLATHPTPFRPGPERREIFVRRQAWSSKSKVLVVIEKGVAPDGTAYESTRYLDLLQDLVLPLYAIPRYNRTEWNIEVGYGQGLDRVDYPFRTQESAWRFQQLLTGYQPVEMFDDITCVVTYKALRLPLPQYKGMGQVQMWVEQVNGSADEHDFDTEQVNICPDPNASRQVCSSCSRTASALGGGFSQG